jgi:hypothetical protein
MSEQTMCACGRPLHYRDPLLQEFVQRMVDELGENIRVTTRERTWLVPRHYLALHGLKAWELEKLGFPEVTDHPTDMDPSAGTPEAKNE